MENLKVGDTVIIKIMAANPKVFMETEEAEATVVSTPNAAGFLEVEHNGTVHVDHVNHVKVA